MGCAWDYREFSVRQGGQQMRLDSGETRFMAGLLRPAEKMGFDLKGREKPMMGFETGNDMVRFIFQKNQFR